MTDEVAGVQIAGLENGMADWKWRNGK